LFKIGINDTHMTMAWHSLNLIAMSVLMFFAAPGLDDALGADNNSDYIDELTRQIFARTETADAAQRNTALRSDYSRNRKLLELIAGERIEYTALPTKPEWEEKLIPIRIPVRKGLQGYRLFLINSEDQAELTTVRTLEQLKRYPIGSGAQWSTTEALENSGFTVIKGPEKEELQAMLNLKRFVAYSRGIDEIFAEHAQWSPKYQSLAVEQEIALFIPHPIYFFVTPERPDLAERIERGLRGMIADGSFDRLFLKFYNDDIQRARLDQRKIFKIPNPSLSPETPLDDPNLWFDPVNDLERKPGNRAHIR